MLVGVTNQSALAAQPLPNAVRLCLTEICSFDFEALPRNLNRGAASAETLLHGKAEPYRTGCGKADTRRPQ
jgi:hypothetical protein